MSDTTTTAKKAPKAVTTTFIVRLKDGEGFATRASATMHYTHAVVVKGKDKTEGPISWHTSRELARKAAESWKGHGYPDARVEEVEERTGSKATVEKALRAEKAPAKKSSPSAGVQTSPEAIVAAAKEAGIEVPAKAAKLPNATEMRKALVATGELTRDQVNAHKGEDLKAAYLNLVVNAQAPAKKAPAKKEVGPKDDAITRHIAQVFAKLPAGTFLKARDITNTVTKEFPKVDERPSDVLVYSRCHGGRLPAGLTGQNKPCGATKG
jgi:hypothetical protein